MPAGVIQALPLATPTSSLVSPAQCPSAAHMPRSPGSLTPQGSIQGVVHGWGEVCLLEAWKEGHV